VPDRFGQLALRARRFALLVDRRGESLGQRGARRVLFRRQCEHFGVAALGVGERALLERRVRHHGPGHAPLLRGCRRLQRKYLACDRGGALAVVQRVELFGGIGQH